VSSVSLLSVMHVLWLNGTSGQGNDDFL